MGARATRFQAGAPRPRVAWATEPSSHTHHRNLAIALFRAAGGFAYFVPARSRPSMRRRRCQGFRRRRRSALLAVTLPSQAAQSQGAFTVLLLGSDDDSKFFADHVLTQSMILVRVVPATKEVTSLIPRDLYAHLSTADTERSRRVFVTEAQGRRWPRCPGLQRPLDGLHLVGLLGRSK